ncbi:hypothetical protein C810_01735 [Lachnospiraceae bacterium A2]|nr:hypothetical protein C810_01735 [Lachnospiraceae bacterium A2]
MRTRRNQAINNTKIKYISVLDKVYEVISIQWLHSYLEARETDLSIDDVPESELWDISYFEDFRVRLVNRKGEAKIIDMAEWLDQHSL